jgi:hypothetical protein
MARVTRLAAADLAKRVEEDPLLGHPVRHFASFGGVDAWLDELSPDALSEALARIAD